MTLGRPALESMALRNWCELKGGRCPNQPWNADKELLGPRDKRVGRKENHFCHLVSDDLETHGKN
jgi:hypothetical protein